MNISNLMDMSGRVALVTGAAGHIGSAIVETLAELGCEVILLDIDEQKLKQQIDALKTRFDREFFQQTTNLEMDSDIADAVSNISNTFGRLDVLVNNAAFVGDSNLDGWIGTFEQQSTETWRRALEVNLTSIFTLSRSLTPMLSSSGKGAIVNIGSIYGSVGPDLALYDSTEMGSPAAYFASKGGLLQLTRWMSTVLAPDVRVNCISPGGIERGQPEIFKQRYVSRTPLRRMGKEEDLKGAIAYLASDMSSYVTGQNIIVDGGWTVW